MRSNKELLKIFLDNQIYFSAGLCTWIRTLWVYDLLTLEEKSYLLTLVRIYRPTFKFKNHFYNPDKVNSGYEPDYYWKAGFINPRIKWLKKYLSADEKRSY